jgi:protein phosphatase
MFGRKKKKEDLAWEQLAVQPSVQPSPAAARNDEVTVQIDKTKGYYINTAMATHIGTREYLQDAAYVCEPLYENGTAFGILCDGMGGMSGGEVASSEVTAFMANRIASLGEDQDIPPFLERAAIDAGELVAAQNAASGQDSGTTLVTVLIREGNLYWLNVGDSRIYILRAGEIARLTRDHNFALELQEMVEAGRITQQQADEDPRKDALVSYIGAPVLEIVDVNRGAFSLRYGDTILLCSDGLTKVLTDEEILEAIQKHGSDISEAARSLPLTAFDQSPGGMDNTSVILMQYLGLNN